MDSRLEQLRQLLESAVEGISDEQMTWHPANKWSSAEVLEHLYWTYTGTIKGFEKVAQAGKPLATPRSIPHWWRTLVVTGFGYFPPGRKAPRPTEPRGLPAGKVRKEFGEKIVAMDAIIAECEARFGHSTRLLDHPILGPLTATQWRKFHWLHGRHHERQILRLRAGMKQ